MRDPRAKLLVYYQGFGNDPTFDIGRFPAARSMLRSQLGGPAGHAHRGDRAPGLTVGAPLAAGAELDILRIGGSKGCG